MCRELLARYDQEAEACFRRIVAGDESLRLTRQRRCRNKNSPIPNNFKVIASTVKMMMTNCWNLEGAVHPAFLKNGNPANSDHYVTVLQKLGSRLLRIRLRKHATLSYNNACPHTGRKTMAAKERLKFNDILPKSSFSPDLTSLDFLLFPKLKEQTNRHS